MTNQTASGAPPAGLQIPRWTSHNGRIDAVMDPDATQVILRVTMSVRGHAAARRQLAAREAAALLAVVHVHDACRPRTRAARAQRRPPCRGPGRPVQATTQQGDVGTGEVRGELATSDGDVTMRCLRPAAGHPVSTPCHDLGVANQGPNKTGAHR